MEGGAGSERDVRKRYFSDQWADREDQALVQAQHAVLTTRNATQGIAVGVRRGDLAHLDEEDERDIKCFELTILTLQTRATAQKIRIKK